jgi:thiamine pyrophosphokinase
MDSVDPDTLAAVSGGSVRLVRHPRRKDATDLELALDFASDEGADEVVMVGAFGGRWDMSLANALLPTRVAYQHMRVSHLADTWSAHWLRGPGVLHLDGSPGDGISLIPLGAGATGVVTVGLEYPLHGETLFAGSTRGISNTIAEDRASVALESGHLLCIAFLQSDQETHL